MPKTLKHRIRQHFNQASESYNAVALVQQEVARRLAERFELFGETPQRLMDLGAGTGQLTRLLHQAFPKGEIWAVDLAEALLQKNVLPPGRFWQKPFLQRICADGEALPFAPGRFDWLVSNVMLQWAQDLPQMLGECRRVLKPQGLILFSTFGPDTLKEVRQAWSEVDDTPHVNRFWDMHDLGDLLIEQGFTTPVMDQETLTLTYDSPRAAIADIRSMGANTLTEAARKGLTGKRHWQEFYAAYEKLRQADGRIPLSFEVVYGHAFVGQEVIKGPHRNKDGVHHISLESFQQLIKTPKPRG